MITLIRGELSPVKEPFEKHFDDFRQAVLTAIEELREPMDEFKITVDPESKPGKKLIHRKNYWAEGIKTCNWDKYHHDKDYAKPFIRQRPKGTLYYWVTCYKGHMALRMPWLGVHPNQAEVAELCDYYNKTHGGTHD